MMSETRAQRSRSLPLYDVPLLDVDLEVQEPPPAPFSPSAKYVGTLTRGSVTFHDRVDVRTLDSQLEGMPASTRRSAGDIKKALFERFFDESTLPLFAGASPLMSGAGVPPRRVTDMRHFRPEDFSRRAPSTVSRTTAATMRLRLRGPTTSAPSSPMGGNGKDHHARGRWRGGAAGVPQVCCSGPVGGAPTSEALIAAYLARARCSRVA
ncbi:hypothetical protein FOA52_015995 [Chlamydomonas sp. UWO 241]|nr:hypothetical protein FOA52_015995 [Chlamydomonas sp. UWO 241]